MVSSEGKLIGLIVTSSDAPTTEARDLHAITPSHINRALERETGKKLSEFLEGDLSASADKFAQEVVPELTALFRETLSGASR